MSKSGVIRRCIYRIALNIVRDCGGGDGCRRHNWFILIIDSYHNCQYKFKLQNFIF